MGPAEIENGTVLEGYTHSMRSLFVSLVALVALVGAADAQTPVERDSIVRYREQLALQDDTLALLRTEAEMIEVARVDRDNALLHVLLGFLAYRIGELTEGHGHYDDAASEFEWAAELEPEWPYPWYGLGLAELAVGEHAVIAVENIRQMLGKDYLSKATGAFARAAAVDPSFTQAVVDLAQTAMTQRIRPRLEVALGALREAGAIENADQPALLVARGRLERLVGNGDSAVAAFTRYVELGADSGLGYFELARSLYFAGRSREAEGTYYLGARAARSPDAIEAYREDVGWIATPDELAEFDATPPDRRGAWMHSFWRGRDAADVRVPGERLREHHRRYFRALERYALVSRHRQYGVEHPYRSSQQAFDDRGVIYMRHGEPDEVARLSAPGVEPNESWLYARTEGNLVFHFAARGDVQDYKLIESLVDVFGPEVAMRVQSGQFAIADGVFAQDRFTETLSELFNSRHRFDPLYQRLAMGGSVQPNALVNERRLGARSIVVGTRTDSYPIRFHGELEAALQRHVVAGASGSELLIVYSVPGAGLVPERREPGAAYRLEARVVVTEGGREVAFVDTVQVVVADHVLGAEEYLHGYVTVPVPPGLYQLKVVMADPARDLGRIAADDSVDVPDFRLPQFAVSDVVLGQEGAGDAWSPGGEPIVVTARRRLPSGVPLQVYYEVHGLRAGMPYRSELEVRKTGGGSVFGWVKRLFGGGGAPVSLALDGVASGPTTRVQQMVDLSDLGDGRYQLTIRVIPADGGEPIERDVDLTLVGT